MKRTILFMFALLLLAGASSAQTVVDGNKTKFTCTVKNPNSTPLTDAPIVITVANGTINGATVTLKKAEIASQFDILDNGATRELSFVTDLKAGETKSFDIVLSETALPSDRYPSRVGAQMFLIENGQNVPKDIISSPVDNMYNKLHHHGPAFESELVAYRLYFDQKQTVDIYGKVIKRLELPTTMFYPTDQQLIDKYGDDVLLVGSSAGVGTLKGWNGTSATHLRNVALREMHIWAKGPVRTVVDLSVKGWQYGGKTIDLRSRYYLYAGHRDVQVSHKFTGEGVQDLTFATGVQKIRKGDVMHTDSRGMVADWGRDFPVNDTIKYPQQTVGLGVSIPSEYVVSPATDAVNYLYVVKPDKDNTINYRLTFSAQKEEFGYKTPEAFFKYIDGWKDEKPVEVKVK